MLLLLSIHLRFTQLLIDRSTDFDLDTDPMDMSLHTPTTIFSGSSQPIATPPTANPVNGRHTIPVPDPSRDMTASSNSASVSTGGQSPNVSPSVLHSISPQSATLYQVSITMVCTQAQLDANMIRLAETGSSVTIQIEKKT